METITPDYLVVGAGAMGMAFVDTLLTESKNATIAIVDRYAQPGGHWQWAYGYVRLHQPSWFYGVNSKVLGNLDKDGFGVNKGLMSMAPGTEVCAYFIDVLNRTFLPSGRVEYFPKHEYLGNGQFKSILSKKTYKVGEKTKIVNATYMQVEVPSRRPPRYSVADGVKVIPPNGLLNIDREYGAYTVIGAGKTGIDAILWLLGHGVDPELVSWVIPRDMWYFDRSLMQAGDEFKESNVASAMATGEAIMEASDLDDMFVKLEQKGQLIRLDTNVKPTMWKCATVSKGELDVIQKVGTIIRKGKVTDVSANKVTLSQGSYTPSPDTLYVDCSANSIPKLPIVPVFNDKHLTLQPVRFCQQGFSAALIAYVEANYNDDKTKNTLTTPVPHPDHPNDFPRQRLQTLRNDLIWKSHPNLGKWVKDSRLDLFGIMLPEPPKDPKEAEDFQKTMLSMLTAQMEKLEKIMRNDVGKEFWTGTEPELVEARL